MSDGEPEGKTAKVHSSFTGTTQAGTNNDVEVASKLEGEQHFRTTTTTSTRSNGFLSAPLSAPVRPLSPDTLSQLSADEYEQIQPGRPSVLFNVDTQSGQNSSLSPTFRNGWRGRVEAFWHRNRGLAYMLVGQVFGTAMNVTVRKLEVEGNNGKGMHPYQILFARMGITFVLATGYMWWKKTPHFPLGMKEVRWLLVARGFGGFFGVFGMYFSLLYLPLADATVITFLAPSLACWACSILIHEPFTRREQLGALVSLVGVVLIARPTAFFGSSSSSGDPPAASGGSGDVVTGANSTSPTTGHPQDASDYDKVTSSQRLMAVGIGLIGVLGAATAYTTIRWIGKRAHPLISVNYFAFWCFLVSIFMQIVLPNVGFILPADLKEWFYLIFLGTCGFIMQFLMAAGLAYEKSSRATNMTYTQMLFALASDKIFFGHTPGWMSIVGSSLIIGSAIVVAMQQNEGPQGDEGNKEQTEGSSSGRTAEEGDDSTDEESRVGLMSGMEDAEIGEDHDRLSMPPSLPQQGETLQRGGSG